MELRNVKGMSLDEKRKMAAEFDCPIAVLDELAKETDREVLNRVAENVFYQSYRKAVAYFDGLQGHENRKDTIENEFTKEHASELVYCYLNHKDLIDFDFWTQYEILLGEKLNFQEYAAIDSFYDGDPNELSKENTAMIARLQNGLKEYREFRNERVKYLQMVADELIYHGQTHTIYSNYIWDKEDLMENYKVTAEEFEEIGNLMFADGNNVLDIDFDSLETGREIDAIFNFTRCPFAEDEVDQCGCKTKLQEQRDAVQDEFVLFKNKYSYLYDDEKKCVVFDNPKYGVISEVLSEIQAMKKVNDKIYDAVDEKLDKMSSLDATIEEVKSKQQVQSFGEKEIDNSFER